jgi:UDP-N-acetylmuramoyl-L-alanyl-D-glutamate--2,6-diaminopimelate ligase
VPAEQAAPSPLAPAPLRPRRARRSRLSELLPELRGTAPGVEVEISGITLDSRLVRPGDLYVALPGAIRHGAEFAGAAAAAGAAAVLTDRAGAERLASPEMRLPVIERADPRRQLGALAAAVYGHPSAGRLMFGITGTNGKTTTSFLLEAALRSAGLSTGVVGTLGFSLDGTAMTGARTTITTPEAPELQAVLAVLAERGAEAIVMEVSSHALALGRADAIAFDVVAFTNFGRDHLDFHGDEQTYFEAKAQLFTPDRARRAVLNVDDPRGRELAERARATGQLEVAGVSLRPGEAEYSVMSSRLAADGRVLVRARAPDREFAFRLALPGEFNVRNALTALAMADQAGVDLDRAAAGLAEAGVPGRMQRVALEPPGPAVFVDFAHTPQAVAAVLDALEGRRRVVVLGCGGDRDPDKREPMGAAAVTGAEVVVVTDDNPRSEDPAAIRAEVLAGAHAEQHRQRGLGREVAVVDGGDRRAAIELGLTRAGRADVLAVLGKGHESGQEVAGRILPFDDVEVLRTVWSALSRRSAAAVQPPPDPGGGT